MCLKLSNKIKNTNLERIYKLKEVFKKYYIGLSDHTSSIVSTIASIPMGVVAIEKHFKLDNETNSVDAKFSITPEKLRELVKIKKDLFYSIKNKKT